MPSDYRGTMLRLRAPGVMRRLPRPQVVTHEKRYWFLHGRYCFHLVYQPWVGLFFTASSDPDTGRTVSDYRCPLKTEKIVKRVVLVASEESIRPALSRESKVLAKCPTLCEFLTATAYEDGTARTPGGFWWDNHGSQFGVVLRNPDAGARLPLLAPTIDEMWAAVEAILKAENAPWQPDSYLQDLLKKKGKKK